jgi:hypothetical protein
MWPQKCPGRIEIRIFPDRFAIGFPDRIQIRNSRLRIRIRKKSVWIHNTSNLAFVKIWHYRPRFQILIDILFFLVRLVRVTGWTPAYGWSPGKYPTISSVITVFLMTTGTIFSLATVPYSQHHHFVLYPHGIRIVK